MNLTKRKYGTRLAASAVAAVGAFALAPASSALAAGGDVSEATSANWSGYVAGGPSSDGSQQFSSVSGSWVEPKADCSSGGSDAAFWVGLGGASAQSGALEQTGTQINCSGGGSGQHYAWYEMVPQAPVKLDVPINAGDHISARVTVDGSNVTVTLANQSTGQSSTKTLQVDNIDVSSAEWIAEAPSQCQGDSATPAAGNCTPVPLANFGSVNFTNSSATANGSTGTISSSNWTAQAVQLNGGSSSAVGDPGVMYPGSSDGSSASASPSSLSTDGSSFSVSVQGAGSQATSSPSSYGDPGSGYGGGNPYGAGDPYGSGGGDPYGYGGGSYGYGGGDPYGYGGGSYGDGGGSYGDAGGVTIGPGGPSIVIVG
jgi:hypothetical protein